MQKTSNDLRALWAVDPFAKHLELQKTAGWILQAIASRQPTVIEPVYVDYEAKLDAPEPIRAGLRQVVAAKAQEGLDSIVSRKNFGTLLPLRFLIHHQRSTKEKAALLLKYAHESEVNLIVANTRSRKGLLRWFLGSFVETLTLFSDLPLLIVNPTWDHSAGFDRILFPTDFSDASHEVFRQVFSLARNLRSELVLFHKFSEEILPLHEMSQSLYGYPNKAAIERELKERENQLNHWISEATQAKVNARGIIDRKRGETVSSSILRQTRQWPGFIAMAAESDALEACILGSVTRNIVRQSTCPVLVMHPSTCVKAQSFTPLKKVS
jgi:nucleotide-binding universal stress UspA family protein